MKNKNSEPKKTSAKDVTVYGIVKRIAGPILWTTVVVVGLWSLMYFSKSQAKLEPYAKFKKTSAIIEDTMIIESDAKLERFAQPNQSEFPDKIELSTEPKPAELYLPRKTLQYIQEGMQLIEEDKYNSANIAFEKAARASPDSPEVFALWGTALRVQEKYKGANRHFAKALELAPNDAEIHFNWGISRFREKAIDEAIKLFKKTVELSPSYHMGWYYLGKAYGQKDNYTEEIKYLTKVIELKPDFGWGHFDLGIALSLQKKFEVAAPHFEKAIDIDKKEFEKPFVVQFLTALGRYNPPHSKKEEKKKPVPVTKETKATVAPQGRLTTAETKTEGSDHKMDEGSKIKKGTTNIKGKMLINSKTPSTNAIVFLETKTKMKVPNQKTLEVTIDQTDLKFTPKHTAVPVGSIVAFSNQDVEVHNIYSKSINNQFNLGAMSSGMIKSIRLLQPGPVVLRCNLHKDMVGTVFVVPNGYYTNPDEQGNYEFNQVKSAGYILQAWAPHLAPGDVEANLKSADLNGEDKIFDFDIKSASLPGEIHDMVEPTDYNAIVDDIESELEQAIRDWESGKKYVSRKRALMAITKHYDGGGLKGALEKSFSEKRSKGLEDKLDDIRKIISGIGSEAKSATGDSLRQMTIFAVGQIRNNVKELEARLNPDPRKLE